MFCTQSCPLVSLALHVFTVYILSEERTLYRDMVQEWIRDLSSGQLPVRAVGIHMFRYNFIVVMTEGIQLISGEKLFIC